MRRHVNPGLGQSIIIKAVCIANYAIDQLVFSEFVEASLNLRRALGQLAGKLRRRQQQAGRQSCTGTKNGEVEIVEIVFRG